MLVDPQIITYATVNQTLPRVGHPTPSGSLYRLATGTVTQELLVTNAFKAQRNRVVTRYSRQSIVANPMNSQQSMLAGATATFTLDFPTAGLLPADVQSQGLALVGYLTSARILQLIMGET